MKSAEEIRKAVIEGIRTVTEKTNTSLDDGQSFENFGLDSLDRMALMLEVEKHLSLDFGESNPDDIHNIQDYIQFIQKNWPEA